MCFELFDSLCVGNVCVLNYFLMYSVCEGVPVCLFVIVCVLSLVCLFVCLFVEDDGEWEVIGSVVLFCEAGRNGRKKLFGGNYVVNAV